jgi:hypothetical protein
MDHTENTVPLLLCSCCHGNKIVCEAIIQKRGLYILSCGRCLEMGLHAMIYFETCDSVYEKWHCVVEIRFCKYFGEISTLHLQNLFSQFQGTVVKV